MIVHIWSSYRGYRTHTDPETDSDGDGGSEAKLRGKGHIEFSQKGIPHGILHFTLQLLQAGHLLMHDTSGPEASHKYNIKTAMGHVKKENDTKTSSSLIAWGFRVRTWAKIIDAVQENDVVITRKRKIPSELQVTFLDSHLLHPTDIMAQQVDVGSFSPLRRGGDNILCNDVRLSYMELATLISDFSGWDLERVLDDVKVELYCSAYARHTSRETRTYWATESRYRHSGGSRRDKVEIDLGRGEKFGVAEITSFIRMSGIDGRVHDGVVIRWMDKSSLSAHTDDYDRPLCDFPLSFNHCLWEWHEADTVRDSFRIRGFGLNVTRQKLWSHVPQRDRERVINSERRAHYDIIGFTSTKCHVNIHQDPSTGHMLQTLQIV